MRAYSALGLFLVGLLSASCLGDGSASFPGLGEPCDSASACREGFCYGPVGRQFCTVVCSGDAACPSGFICEPEPQLENRLCLPGARCREDTDCPLGHRCDAQRGACHLAVKRDLCGACTSDEQCPDGGICVRARSTGERFCSIPCQNSRDCPHGFGCRSLTHEGVSYDGETHPRQCIPEGESCQAQKPLCSPCRGDWECGSALDLCLEDRSSGVRHCGRHCRPSCLWDDDRHGFFDRTTGEACESGCPPGFACLEIGDSHQCIPETVSCEDYCDASTPLEERMQCGLGRACDRMLWRCVTATDGRSCAPCEGGACPGGQGSLCVANHSTGEDFCASPCTTNAECLADYGPGFSCRSVGSRSVCLPDRGSCLHGASPLGADCERGEDCQGSLCLRRGDRGLCSAPCTSDGDCGDARWICCARAEGAPGYDCDLELGEEGGACVPRGGRFGDACEPGRPPCEEGYCLDLGSDRVCTVGCETDADCDAASGEKGAFHCRGALLDSDVWERVNVCFPRGGGAIGSDCSFGPAACADGICLDRTLGRICSRECRGDECPPGWRCDFARFAGGAELRVCLPN